MIHFLEQHFVELVTITSIIYLTLATILLLYQTPDTAVYKTFRRSKRLMAGGMMLISLNIWIWIASFLQEAGRNITTGFPVSTSSSSI